MLGVKGGIVMKIKQITKLVIVVLLMTMFVGGNIMASPAFFGPPDCVECCEVGEYYTCEIYKPGCAMNVCEGTWIPNPGYCKMWCYYYNCGPYTFDCTIVE